jgi:hypothetical protein
VLFPILLWVGLPTTPIFVSKLLSIGFIIKAVLFTAPALF